MEKLGEINEERKKKKDKKEAEETDSDEEKEVRCGGLRERWKKKGRGQEKMLKG